MTLPKVEGTIHVSFTCECPHCENYIDTDHDEEFKSDLENINEHWFCDFEDDDLDNIEIECPECNKKFIVEKFTHLI